MSIIFAIMIFSFLVITHEFGHFLMAKKAGIGVIEFSVGMGAKTPPFSEGGDDVFSKADSVRRLLYDGGRGRQQRRRERVWERSPCGLEFLW